MGRLFAVTLPEGRSPANVTGSRALGESQDSGSCGFAQGRGGACLRSGMRLWDPKNPQASLGWEPEGPVGTAGIAAYYHILLLLLILLYSNTVFGPGTCPWRVRGAAQGPPDVAARLCPAPRRTRRGRPLSPSRRLRNGRAEEGKAPKIPELTGTNNYPGNTWLSWLSSTAEEKSRCHHLRLTAPSGLCHPPAHQRGPEAGVAGPGVPPLG